MFKLKNSGLMCTEETFQDVYAIMGIDLHTVNVGDEIEKKYKDLVGREAILKLVVADNIKVTREIHE